MEGYNVRITCPCGAKYDAPEVRLVKCPACGHVWDLFPPGYVGKRLFTDRGRYIPKLGILAVPAPARLNPPAAPATIPPSA